MRIGKIVYGHVEFAYSKPDNHQWFTTPASVELSWRVFGYDSLIRLNVNFALFKIGFKRGTPSPDNLLVTASFSKEICNNNEITALASAFADYGWQSEIQGVKLARLLEKVGMKFSKGQDALIASASQYSEYLLNSIKAYEKLPPLPKTLTCDII